jgi:hypothetical protein
VEDRPSKSGAWMPRESQLPSSVNRSPANSDRIGRCVLQLLVGRRQSRGSHVPSPVAICC